MFINKRSSIAAKVEIEIENEPTEHLLYAW